MTLTFRVTGSGTCHLQSNNPPQQLVRSLHAAFKASGRARKHQPLCQMRSGGPGRLRARRLTGQHWARCVSLSLFWFNIFNIHF